MAIVTLAEILRDAHAARYAVGMFDVHNLEMTNAVIETAEEERSPVIIALAEVHATSRRALEDIAHIMVYAARRARVPVCVHFDHGVSLENCVRVLHQGFSSVMYDGSMLPYAENLRGTAEVVRFARIFDASVEGELGHVGGGEGGEDDGHGMVYTDPAQTADFVEKTGVDALAVSIGTVHGAYKEEPKLDLQRLREIRAKCPVPLVLHGGSGLSDRDFRNCVQGGISKINIYTELVQVAMNRIQCEVAAPYSLGCADCGDGGAREELVQRLTAILTPLLTGTGEMKYPDLMRLSTEGMKEAVRAKLRLFGSAGRAAHAARI